jgi:hypothetical protein
MEKSCQLYAVLLVCLGKPLPGKLVKSLGVPHIPSGYDDCDDVDYPYVNQTL